jgi:rod shape-determining protein MreD
MIMRSGEQLLLPVNPLFLWFSLVAALALNMGIDMAFGRSAWMPDFLAIALVFWAIHQPLRVGIGAAFLFGLCMDVHQSSLLGQHAWAYSLLGFGAVMLHRRVLWYPLLEQAVQLLPLFILAHAVEVSLRMLAGGVFPGWGLFAAPLIETALWPIATWVLLAPQRRPPDPDAHRPL